MRVYCRGHPKLTQNFKPTFFSFCKEADFTQMCSWPKMETFLGIAPHVHVAESKAQLANDRPFLHHLGTSQATPHGDL